MPYKTQFFGIPNEMWTGEIWTAEVWPAEIWEWLARAVGAVLGSAISIAYLLPSTRREAALRFLTGLGVGLVFGTLTGHKLALQLELQNILSPVEITLIGATTASLCAWWSLGILSRLASRYGNAQSNLNKENKAS